MEQGGKDNSYELVVSPGSSQILSFIAIYFKNNVIVHSNSVVT